MPRSLFVFVAGLFSACVLSAGDAPPAARGLLLDAARAGNAVIAVGERGTILRSADSGHSWENIPSPTGVTLTAIAFAGEERGWAVGHDGVILHTRDGGLSWSQQYSDNAISFLDIAATDIRHATAVGAFGAYFTTDDGGATWKQQRLLEEDLHLNRISLDPDGTAFVAGERGTLLHRLHGDDAFAPIPTNYDGSFFGVLPLAGKALLAYGLRGHIYRSGSEAISWQAIPSPSPALLTTAIQLKSGVIVLAGQARNFFVSTDDGLTFHLWTAPLTTSVAELLEAPDGTLLAFGEGGATRLPPPE